MKNEKEIQEEIENSEDTTKYGEFVTSYFAWIPLEMQKDKAKKMEDMTKRIEKLPKNPK